MPRIQSYSPNLKMAKEAKRQATPGFNFLTFARSGAKKESSGSHS
jgi:hypothetical protein